MALVITQDLIRQRAMERLARVFNVDVRTLRPDSKFGTDLRAGPRSFFKENAFDEIDADIRDAADRRLQAKMADGEYEITSVADYCAHMVRCYALRPRVVSKILGLDKL